MIEVFEELEKLFTKKFLERIPRIPINRNLSHFQIVIYPSLTNNLLVEKISADVSDASESPSEPLTKTVAR